MLRRLLASLRTGQGRDHVLTYLGEGLVLVGTLVVYRLAADAGRDELDLYVVVRRTVSFAFPFILLGSAVGITRYVAMRGGVQEQRRYLAASLGWVLPLALLTFVVGLLWPVPLAWVVFGSGDQAHLVAPLALMVASVSVYGLGYAYLRGRGKMLAANAAQVLALAGSPWAAFLLFDDLASVCWATGAGWTAVAAACIVPQFKAGLPRGLGRERGDLLRYGMPRVPGDLAFGALLTVPVYAVARTHGLAASGEVGFGATLLNITAALFAPLSLVLLPSSASQLAAGDHAGLSRRIGHLSRMTLLASAAMTIAFELAAGPILELYLGATADHYVDMSRIAFLGALPFGVFIGLRSLLDAYYHTPRNGINLSTAFLLLLLGSLFHFVVPTPAVFMAWVMVGALGYLGWATWRDVAHVRAELDRHATRPEGSLLVLVVRGRATAPHGLEATGATVQEHRVRAGSWSLGLRDRWRLKRTLRTFRPDVLLVPDADGPGLFAVLHSAVPVVVTIGAAGPGRAPGWRAQATAFFAAGILCRDEASREGLWWRRDDARSLPVGDGPAARPGELLHYLRAVALHRAPGTAAA
ncbi:MAG: lipopolysaccharide biosynthesis protein [Flavobacteriales bacterium]|nr:hypothetical protein [Flavobacteriales bacterium]MCC6575749.1 lipopolysaccharide biosynthesis protein [Flavobacteriales bacterium]